MHISPRINAILECVKSRGPQSAFNALADIGTDHAYLPIEACRKGLCARAVACDINPAPLKMADAHIRAAELEGQIETRLGDGLSALKPNEADCIVIAGMGGMRIIKILTDEAEKAKSALLVLQPQHDTEQLRRYLHTANFEILREKLTQEGSRFYVIITAAYNQNAATWNEKDYFLGLKDEHDEYIWVPYLRSRLDKIKRYADSINDKNASRIAAEKMEWLNEAIREAPV